MSGPSPALNRAAWIAAGVAILASPYIDLELAADLGPWHANAPVADIAAIGLMLVVGLSWLRRAPPLRLDRWRWRAPGLAGYAVFLVAGLLSLGAAEDAARALHHWLRKPLFLYLAYGVALSWWVSRQRDPVPVLRLAAAATLLSAVVAVGAAALRIGAGDALWFQSLAHLTPNHKTLAVAQAGWLPLVLVAWRRPGKVPWDPTTRRLVAMATVAALLAIALSASKTAMIASVFALGMLWPAARPLSTRWRLAIPTAVLAFGLAYYAPVLMGSKAMLDAARSRHSLNKRAWMMFAAHPLTGAGTGTNVHVIQVTFPDYRVNGVDAHGVVQKVASETGLVGLAGFGWFSLALGAGLVRRWDGRAEGLDYAALGTFAALNLELVLSTETLSPTHWAPLAVAWGLGRRPPTGRGETP